MERRINWKEYLSQEAQEKQTRKMELLDELDAIRTDMRTCGTDFARRDALALTYRETVARLATL